MSLHSQLLRGLLALPVVLLLTIAGVIAPDAASSPASLPVRDPVAATGEVPATIDAPVRTTCPREVVRVQLADR